MRRLILVLFLCLLCGWGVWAKTNMSQVDLRHGNKQVVKMLADRPAMASYTSSSGKKQKVTRQDHIWQWAATRYGTRIHAARVEWDNHPVQCGMEYIAEHDTPENGENGRIRIRSIFTDEYHRTRRATFDELWSACVFELFNIQSSVAFDGIYTQAINGDLSRDEWLRLNTQLEHKALMKEVAFFRTVWVPWCKQRKRAWDSKAWDLDTPTDYAKWIRQYQVPGNSYIAYWQDYYDEEIVPYLKSIGKKVPKD